MPSSKPSFEYALSSDEGTEAMGFISVVVKVVGLGQGIQSRNAQVINGMSRNLDMGTNPLSSMLPGSI